MSGNPPPASGPISLKVWGDFACFTRPEFGVERVSYPMMTPTAAVGVLDAIFWKPQFRWRIAAIDVLRPAGWIQVRRNEIQNRQTYRVAKGWAEGDDAGLDVAEVRTQRSGLILYGVAYAIHAHAEVCLGVPEQPAKFRDQLRRRVERGQCHERPYLGCREFPCEFAPFDSEEPRYRWSEHLGPMVLSVYSGSMNASGPGEASPLFFDAEVRGGRLTVPGLPEGRR
ncbi:MAG: type I-C CRISPR-associated protein Cas5c [Actinomycetota bacterium]